jgi:hypothetical protein
MTIRISGGAMLAGIGNRIMLPLGSASTPRRRQRGMDRLH